MSAAAALHHDNGASGPVVLWQAGRFQLDLSRPRVMGIVNVTPDSFSDGGSHTDACAALNHAEALLRAGADLLDIGGESTRPGATPVSLDLELQRVLPVVREAVRLGVPVSVDTYKAAVMRAVLDVGADIINDIWALRQAGADAAVAAHPACGVCLMHMHGEPQSMQVHPMSVPNVETVIQVVEQFLQQRTQHLHSQGVAADRIVWDVGTGFGKTPEQNFALLAHQARFVGPVAGVLAAWSRKSSLGAVTGLNVNQRLIPSITAALLAVERGARIVRVHDVAETVQALQVWGAVAGQSTPDIHGRKAL